MHYYELPAINDAVNKIREKIPIADIYEQLAEEAAELAQAANKMARVIRGVNPTDIDENKAMKHVIEEYTDVHVVAKDILELQTDGLIADYKIIRWATRLNEKESKE